MPRRCKACDHPQLEELNATCVDAKQGYRKIAERFGLSVTTVYRHTLEHIPRALFIAEAQDIGQSVRQELTEIYRKIKLMLQACDEWLQDPDRPGHYSLEPRAEEVKVIYREFIENEDGSRMMLPKKKEWLAVLLRRLEDDNDYVIQSFEWKRADPRKLIIETANSLRAQLELTAKLLGEMPKDDITLVINNPVFVQLQAAIMEAVAPYPAVKAKLAGAFSRLEKS